VPFPTSALTLPYFCCSLAQRVSHKTIKVYLAGIHLKHLKRSLPDPTKKELLHVLCLGIKKSQGNLKRTCLPITISILCSLKTQLQQQASFSLLEKYLLWAAFTLAFYSFLRASEFTTNKFSWSDLQLDIKYQSLLIQQSKTDSFCCAHILTIYDSDMYVHMPVKAMQQIVNYHQRHGPLFYNGRFTPLNQHKLTVTLRTLLHPTGYIEQNIASHSFRIGAATTAAATGLPPWLIKTLVRWSSDAYETYI